MDTTKTILIVSIILSVTSTGFFLMSFVFAQNNATTNSTNVEGTGTTDAGFGAMIGGIITAAVSFIIAVTGLIKVLPLPKQVGTAATIGADTAHAVMDNRENLVELFTIMMDIFKISNPEKADEIMGRVTPLGNKISDRLNEYTPKVQQLEQVASKINKQGDNTTDGIKEIADKIPENIVKTSVKED